MTKEFDLGTIDLAQAYALITRVVAPRPIALVSSRSAAGQGNLAPFSYFMAGGANPPSCVICPMRTHTGVLKDTARNIEETGEYVINVCTAPMAERVNRCSFDYPRGVDEMERSGFTPIASRRVRPPRVAESPIQLECRLHRIVPHGCGPLSSNYIIGEILHLHVAEEVLGPEGLPDDAKIPFIARLGASWYARVDPECLFEMARPREP